MQKVNVLTVINSDSEQLYKFNTKPDVWQRLSSYMNCTLEQWAGVMKEYSRITSGNHIQPLLFRQLFIITRLSLRLCSGTTNLIANLTKLQKQKSKRSCTWTLLPSGNTKRNPTLVLKYAVDQLMQIKNTYDLYINNVTASHLLQDSSNKDES